MKRKADVNLEIAQKLINKQDTKYCATAVHCSYYAVFQYMKYMLAHTDKDPISYDNQTKNAKDTSSSHEDIFGEIKKRIKNPKEAKDFIEGVRNLKRNRLDADYTMRIFSIEESLDCRQQAKGLITKLKKIFGNI